MPFERVHDYDVEKGTKEARLRAVNPIRRWVSQDHPPINYQNGVFMDDGGNKMEESDVPEYIRKNVVSKPVVPSGEKAAASIRFCPVCREKNIDMPVPSDKYEEHLMAHARGVHFSGQKTEKD